MNWERHLKIGSLASGAGLITLPFGGWVPALIAAGVGYMVGKKQFPAGERPWREINQLLQEGEHGRLEFKARLHHNGKKSPFEGIIKSVAAFANTNGGELILGVCDDRRLTGIQENIDHYGSKDKFECSIRSAIRSGLDASIDKLYRLKFESHDGKTLCRLEVEKSSDHVFSKDRGDFFIRDGNRTVALSPREFKKLSNQDKL